MGKLFAPLWAKIALGCAVALVLALGVQTWRLSRSEARVDALRTELAGEEARHAVTRQSVDTLTAELARLVKEGKLRQERVEKAMERVADDTAPLREEARRIEEQGLGDDYVRRLQEMGL